MQSQKESEQQEANSGHQMGQQPSYHQQEIAVGMPVGNYYQGNMVPMIPVNVAVLPNGQGMCYAQGCPNLGRYSCALYFCCKNLGCGDLMCEDHKSKIKCWPGVNACGAGQHVCLKDEKRLRKRTLCMFALIFISTLIILVVSQVVPRFLMANDDEEKQD